jgi:hypothetical protein
VPKAPDEQKRLSIAEVFEQAFDDSCELLHAEELLQVEKEKGRRLSKALRGHLEKKTSRLSNNISPGAKRGAIDRKRPLLKAAREEIQRNGAPDNLTQFVNQLAPHLTTTKKNARKTLKEAFDLRGRPGRKSK